MPFINPSDHLPRPNLVGLDLVRVLAMGLVALQHTMSLAEREDLTSLAGLSIGQLGVAMFLVVSGFLSFESRRTPTCWLWQRLCRVYPAFWIAMIGSFSLTTLSGYKNVSVGQIVSQMLGTGLWTHPDKLVNLPTWFVSVILACYFATFLSRLIKRPGLIASISIVGLTFLVARDAAPWLLSHFLTYAVASTIAAYGLGTHRKAAIVSIAGVLTILALLIQPAFAYTAISLVIVELSLRWQARSRTVKLAADYTYEFFLVHGVALAGAMTVMKSSPVLAAIAALFSSAVAAMILKHLAAFIVRQFSPTEQSTDAKNFRTEAVKAQPPIKALPQM